uniref:(California timema) hypothetical protein n=1 Tax=Timema californicum TaxID=61474 RepID=A0A7R9JCX6_TIMCA|nr:unnamed protein product [Timema californicum]
MEEYRINSSRSHSIKTRRKQDVDLESLLGPIETCDPDTKFSCTENVQRHVAYSVGMYTKCNFYGSLSKYRRFTGGDCTDKLVEMLVDTAKRILDYYTGNLIASPNFKNRTIVSENLVIIEMELQEIYFDMQINAGFAILETLNVVIQEIEALCHVYRKLVSNNSLNITSVSGSVTTGAVAASSTGMSPSVFVYEVCGQIDIWVLESPRTGPSRDI